MNELGRVLDPDELRRDDGPVGRFTVDVLDDWLRDGATIEVIVPSRVACARCEGGGCDACGRSGAFRLDLDERARTLTLTLPRAPETKTVTVRLVRPFESDATIGQLWVEVRAGESVSASCRRLTPARPPSPPLVTNPVAMALLLALAILIAVIVAAQK